MTEFKPTPSGGPTLTGFVPTHSGDLTPAGSLIRPARVSYPADIAGWHRPLLLLAAALVPLAVISGVGVFADHRMLVGVPIWLKPFKFSISFIVYSVTWAWMTPMLRRAARTAWWVGTAIAVVSALEIVIIVVQVVRGKQSHFNLGTPLDAGLYVSMGVMVGALWGTNLLVAILLSREKLPDRADGAAIRLGLALSLLGMSAGFLMLIPTSTQLSALRAGGSIGILGAHGVDVPDGGPSMPITGWSMTGGDLRIPHFVGIHALQALPLLAIGLRLLAHRVTALRSATVRLRLVLVAASGYLGLLLLVLWQALRGQPLAHPDVLTGVAFVALVAGTAIATVRAIRGPVEEVR